MEASLRQDAPSAAGSTTSGAQSRDDDLLMERITVRDEQAFRTLVERYQAPAHGLALRILQDAALAEEATQDAFFAVWQKPENYDASRGSVRGWLMGVVHHRAVDRTRREQTHRNLATTANPQSELEEDIADQVAGAIDLVGDRQRMRAALERLPIEQRHVIDLMYFGGFSQSQISTALSIPLGTTKSRCRHAMQRLRTEFS